MDFYGSGGLFVEYIELNLCIKFQVNQTYVVRGMAFRKWHFWALIYSTTIRPIGFMFLGKILAHYFQLLGQLSDCKQTNLTVMWFTVAEHLHCLLLSEWKFSSISNFSNEPCPPTAERLVAEFSFHFWQFPVISSLVLYLYINNISLFLIIPGNLNISHK